MHEWRNFCGESWSTQTCKFCTCMYSVSETLLWGPFLLSLKILKYGVRGRAADNPPEVDICKLLTANSTHLLPNTTDPSRWMRGPLSRAARSTTNFRAARPLHFTRAVVRREDQARAAASQPSISRRACSRAPDAPRSGCVGHSVSRNPPSRPSC